MLASEKSSLKRPSTSDDLIFPEKRKRRRRENKEVFFQEFRLFIIEKYPNLAWLGPTTMAVYCYKTYLNGMGWVRCQKYIKAGKAHRQERGRGHFYHIPGQYLKDGKERMTNILSLGKAGIHYADSYISLYNMIRRYGRFSRLQSGEVKLVGYVGPALPEFEASKVVKRYTIKKDGLEDERE